MPEAYAGEAGSIPGSERSPGEGNGNPLLYFCLENPIGGGAWQATVHGVAQSRTRLKRLSSSSSKLLEEAGLNEKKGKLRKEPTFKTGMREEDEAPN